MLGAALACLVLLSPLRAVIFYSTADLNYNTTAPTGPLANSGWQWVGYWGGYQGAPIGPHHFLAANHVGGTVGDPFVFQGISYTTISTYGDASSDLRIWEISGTFPTWAPLYRSSNEVGQDVMVYGRGVVRGAEVRTTVTGSGMPPLNSLAGWQWTWTGSDGRLRWGQNKVVGTFTYAPFGEQLVAYFDQGGGSNECHLGTGDSSAPVFINDGSGWKLAGVAGLVDGGFSTTSGGATFNAAIFDKRGLFLNGNTNPQTGSNPMPSAFYATRVSARLAWIDGVLPTTVDSSDAPLLTPLEALVFAALLFGAGAIFLRKQNQPDKSAE